jgi:hypothetical protein
MTQTTQQQFTFDQSGKQFTCINVVQATSSLTAAYVVKGTTSSLSIVVLGCLNAGGEQVVDSYVGNTSTVRTISLTQAYDYSSTSSCSTMKS